MKKTILVTTSTFPRWKDDNVPLFVYYLSKELNKKFKVVVLAPHYPGAKKKEFIYGLLVYRYRYFFPESLEKLCYGDGIVSNLKSNPLFILLIPFLLISSFYNQYKIIKLEKIDLIHAHWIIPQGFISVLSNKIFKLTVITTAHIGDLAWSKNFLVRFFLRYTIKNSKLVTANSSYTKKQISSIYQKEVRIIPMGIDINKFKNIRSNFIKKKYNTKGHIILFVGRLVEKKGVIYLVRAILGLSKKYPDITLFILGDGSEKNNIENEIKKLNLESNIKLLGYVNQEELPRFYSSSDIMVVPSIITKEGDTEGLGIVILEAMASSLPVIATNVGGITDLIKDKKTGLLVKEKNSNLIEEAVLKLLKDNNLRKNLIKNSNMFVKTNYSWEKIGGEFIKIMR